jgi:hypothetical protein
VLCFWPAPSLLRVLSIVTDCPLVTCLHIRFSPLRAFYFSAATQASGPSSRTSTSLPAVEGVSENTTPAKKGEGVSENTQQTPARNSQFWYWPRLLALNKPQKIAGAGACPPLPPPPPPPLTRRRRGCAAPGWAAPSPRIPLRNIGFRQGWVVVSFSL